MNVCSGRPKYSVSWSKTAQVVEPPGVHSNGLPPQSDRSMPRCSAYQSRRLAACPARWNTPPIPVTRSTIAMLGDAVVGPAREPQLPGPPLDERLEAQPLGREPVLPDSVAALGQLDQRLPPAGWPDEREAAVRAHDAHVRQPGVVRRERARQGLE